MSAFAGPGAACPHHTLADILRSPDCAVVAIEVDRLLLVTRLQRVTELVVRGGVLERWPQRHDDRPSHIRRGALSGSRFRVASWRRFSQASAPRRRSWGTLVLLFDPQSDFEFCPTP